MSLSNINPNEASRLIQDGAVVIDIRGADEYAREHIPGAKNISLDAISPDTLAFAHNQKVIFHCRSGMRTSANAQRLAEAVKAEAFILAGGIDAWKKEQHPVVKDAAQPLELQRQVQIGAGFLALTGCVLGLTISPKFHYLSGFVGAGLLFAGITGFCGMAKILMHMPWNKR
jgi:Rhodanese-related sulfurtransferase